MKIVKPILLIGGTGRSGTTNLCETFSRHPLLTNIPELRFWIDADGIIDFYSSIDNWSPYIYDRKIKRLEKLLDEMTHNEQNLLTKILVRITKKSTRKLYPRYIGAGISEYSPNFSIYKKELLDQLKEIKYSCLRPDMTILESKQSYFLPYLKLNATIESILSEFLRNYTNDVINNQNVEFYLEKNTWNILFFDKIIKLLPESKLVHVYRDPRKVILSFMRQPWLPNDLESAAKVYVSLMNRWQEIKKTLPSNTYYEVSVEEINKHTEKTIKLICAFWRIPYSDNLTDIKFNKNESSDWKTGLNKEQIEYLNQITKPYLKEYKYDS